MNDLEKLFLDPSLCGGGGIANGSLPVYMFARIARRVWKSCCGGYWMRDRSSTPSVTRIVCLRRDGVIAEISDIASAEFSSLGKCNDPTSLVPKQPTKVMPTLAGR